MRELESDPEWVARQERLNEERLKRVEQYDKDAAPLIDDLASIGYEVRSISELYHSYDDCRLAIPVLLRWFPRLKNINVKSSIARALTDKAARPLAGPLLAEEFRTVSCPAGFTEVQLEHYKTTVANALSVVAEDLMFEEISELILDRRHGWTRAPLAVALRRMKNPAAIDVLERILDEDPDLNDDAPALIVHTIRALGNRKAIGTRGKIERFLRHTSPLVRKEAQRALDKFDRAEQKAREKALNKQ